MTANRFMCGKIFCSYREAKEYAHDTIIEKYADKAVIGMFAINLQSKDRESSFFYFFTAFSYASIAFGAG